MKLTREQMLATLGTRDPANNGRFIIGVLSTGIYCLPSCSARTPKPENVRFFANGKEAQSFGLRACKKCRPDLWESGRNVELESLEALVATVRENPAQFGSIDLLAKTLGIGPSSLNERFHLHYQVSPGECLLQTKYRFAQRLLVESNLDIGTLALESGFDSLSAFNEGFRRRFGMTPSSYRQLLTASRFTLALPDNFDLNSFTRSFFRDPDSPTERRHGSDCRLVTPNGTLVRFRLGNQLEVEVALGSGLDAVTTLHRVMGFAQSPKAFEQLAVERGLGRLVAGRTGARIPQTYSVFDGLIWAIVGQQINLPFAFRLRQRLFQVAGTAVGDDLIAIPRPEAVAKLDPDQLKAIQLSTRKIEYLQSVAALGHEVIEGFADLSFTSAKNRLSEMRGLGIWSVNYLLMRTLGFPDCVPLGDTGLTSGLVKLHGLDAKPDPAAVERLLQPLSPHRSLATYHLWQTQ